MSFPCPCNGPDAGRMERRHRVYGMRLSLKQLFSVCRSSRELDDKAVIRGIIGLLAGAPSEVFEEVDEAKEPVAKDGSHFRVKSNTSLKDISTGCFHNFLTPLTRYGTAMRSLFSLMYPEPELDQVWEELSSTLVAFLLSLRMLCNHHLVEPLINNIGHFLEFSPEADVQQFLNYISSESGGHLLAKIEFLNSLHQKVAGDSSFQFNFKSSAHLLDVLFQYLTLEEGDLRAMVWTLFLNTLKPSLDYFENLLAHCSATDPREEFCFDVKQKVAISDAFWDQCLQVRGSYEDGVARLFQPFLDSLTLGVKSRLVLECCPSASKVEPQQSQSIPMFDVFILKLEAILKVRSGADDQRPKNCDGIETGNKRGRREVQVKPLRDLSLPVFANETAFDSDRAYFDFTYKPFLSLPTFNVDTVRPQVNHFHILPENSIVPLSLAIEKALFLSVKQFTDAAANQLMVIFRDPYLEQLRVFNDYFLIHQNSHQLSLYLDSVFNTITGSNEPNIMSIDFQFEDSHDVRAFLVQESSDEFNGSPFSSARVLERLHLIYEDVDNISKMLINTDARQVYDSAFQMLLKLRYCKWLLDHLRYDGPGNDGCGSAQVLDDVEAHKQLSRLQHHLYLVRFRFQFIVNSLHSFVMNRLDQEITTLTEASRAAMHFEDLRNHFCVFIRSVSKITFQGSTAHQKLMRKMCVEALRMKTLWSYDFKLINNNDTQSLVKQISALNLSVDQFEKVIYFFLEGQAEKMPVPGSSPRSHYKA